ncbi:hypothetical protein NEOLI_001983 [Neolecta irregularis DAH-3]|uniref:Arrestin-like N-terminal domain-containing protein n=1 Tax=Neolecta irregularis (strain DAH-3) TaxID=1198029 RepID=A0A1U7LWH7_NEOID|nr:hypothetical protein NEOLI_001983 [Neolecta irregularis DAH-3]|eukprot:OLL26979.1 hypothetical protein NEOLI_001983 [Neolecta irregularis DAH-3]
MLKESSPVLSDAATFVYPQTTSKSELPGHEQTLSISSLPRDKLFIEVDCIQAYPRTEKNFTFVLVQGEICLDRIIRGRIVLCLSHPLLAKRIIASVKATKSIILKDKSLIRNLGHRHEETLWNRVTSVWTGDIIPANTPLEFPFSVTIPSTLPPSLQLSNGSFTYTVKVYTSRGLLHKGISGTPLISQIVFVNVPAPIPLESLEHQPSQTLHYAYPMSSRFSVHFTIPTTVHINSRDDKGDLPVAVHFTSHPPGTRLPEFLSFEWTLIQHARFTFRSTVTQQGSLHNLDSTTKIMSGREIISTTLQTAVATKVFHISLTNSFIAAGDMKSQHIEISHSLDVSVLRAQCLKWWKSMRYKNDKRKWTVSVPITILDSIEGSLYHS